MKVNAARPKIVSVVLATLISGLLVSIPVPAQAAACNPTSTTVSGETVLTFTTVSSCDWTVPESVTKTAAATKAVAAATVAAKVAVAAKEAAAKVPAKAKIIPKASTSTNKNSATATVTGLKPGQKVKVTVNVKGK